MSNYNFITTEKRSKLMKKIKNKNTKPEILLRKKLWKIGYRYIKNSNKIEGKPDIIFLKQKVAVFIDGEFWHGYNWESKKLKIQANKDYWIKKIEKNIERDKHINERLKTLGWIVLRFWEKEINTKLEDCIEILSKILCERGYKMANQTKTGKAFEYCIAKTYCEYFQGKGLKVLIVEDSSLNVAKEAYLSFDENERKKYEIAAYNTIETMLVIEPGLRLQQKEDDVLKIRLATDAEGQKGDVRDVIFDRRNIKPQWEIGFSAKNNHDAVKHSRLSPTIDFGKEWLGYTCSQEYFKEINDVFGKIQEQIEINKNAKWDIFVNKDDDIYKPILDAFRKEIMKITSNNVNVPKNLLSYLIGKYPFYKIIKDDSHNLVIVKAYNIDGLLNKKIAGVDPLVKTPKINLPTRIIELVFKENSKNTLIMTLDQGWQISFRIHNASSKLEKSLKFDIMLIGNPPILFTQHLFAIEN